MDEILKATNIQPFHIFTLILMKFMFDFVSEILKRRHPKEKTLGEDVKAISDNVVGLTEILTNVRIAQAETAKEIEGMKREMRCMEKRSSLTRPQVIG